MNVMWVCGALRLEKKANSAVRNEKGAEDNTNKQDFDACPPEEAKEKMEHANRLTSKYKEIWSFGGALPERWWEYDSVFG